MTFKAYMDNIEVESGKTSEDFWKLANKKGFVKRGKVAAKHADILAWLKSDVGLAHVRGDFIILYLRLRANDPAVSAQSRNWAYTTG
jgi:hypothetical protein